MRSPPTTTALRGANFAVFAVEAVTDNTGGTSHPWYVPVGGEASAHEMATSISPIPHPQKRGGVALDKVRTPQPALHSKHRFGSPISPTTPRNLESQSRFPTQIPKRLQKQSDWVSRIVRAVRPRFVRHHTGRLVDCCIMRRHFLNCSLLYKAKG